MASGIALFLSGLLASHPKTSSIGTRYTVTFASGVVVAAAMFEMIPEADVPNNWPFLSVGFFVFYLLEFHVSLNKPSLAFSGKPTMPTRNA